MSANLDTVILWEDAVERFKNEELPFIMREYEGDGEIDYTARSETWSNFKDMLCQDEEISDWQNDNWNYPRCCLTDEEIRDQRQ